MTGLGFNVADVDACVCLSLPTEVATSTIVLRDPLVSWLFPAGLPTMDANALPVARRRFPSEVEVMCDSFFGTVPLPFPKQHFHYRRIFGGADEVHQHPTSL